MASLAAHTIANKIVVPRSEPATKRNFLAIQALNDAYIADGTALDFVGDKEKAMYAEAVAIIEQDESA